MNSESAECSVCAPHPKHGRYACRRNGDLCGCPGETLNLCSVVKKLAGNWFHCINDSHFHDGSHIHYMRRLPDVNEPHYPQRVRLHPDRYAPADIPLPFPLPGT